VKTMRWDWIGAVGGAFLSLVCLAQDTNKPAAPPTGPTDSLPYKDISKTNQIDHEVFFFSAPDEVLRQAAEGGDASAQMVLGYKLLKEKHQYSEAIKWLTPVAQGGSRDAGFLLDFAKIRQQAKPKDQANTLPEINQLIYDAAAKDIAYAQWVLSKAVAQGSLGYEQNEKLGAQWCLRAATNGCCLALATMANNSDENRDLERALDWYLQLANKGEVVSKYNAAVILIMLVARDAGDKANMSKKLAQARDLLNSCIANGLRANAEDVLAFLDMLSATRPPKIVLDQKKKPHSAELVGRIAKLMDPDMKKVDESWSDYVADHGFPGTVYDLIHCRPLPFSAFIKARDRNVTTAIQWYKLAADNGDSRSATALGLCCMNGKGSPADTKQAKKWLLIAAKAGDVEAQGVLGALLANSFGDDVGAYKWLDIAIKNEQKKNGLPEQVSTVLKSLEKHMTAQQVVQAQSRARAFREGKVDDPEDEAGPDAIVGCKGFGTGFFVTPDGYIITACHVVGKSKHIEIKVKTGNVPVEIIHTDSTNDIAILKAAGTFPVLPLADSGTVGLGDAVTTIGFPNPRVQGFSHKLTRGEVSSLAGMQDDPHYFQIDAPIQPGNSGGPLLNASGGVIGILVSSLQTAGGAMAQNVNYAVKSACVLDMIKATPKAYEKLPKPRNDTRTFSQIVKDATSAIVMILVY